MNFNSMQCKFFIQIKFKFFNMSMNLEEEDDELFEEFEEEEQEEEEQQQRHQENPKNQEKPKDFRAKETTVQTSKNEKEGEEDEDYFKTERRLREERIGKRLVLPAAVIDRRGKQQTLAEKRRKQRNDAKCMRKFGV